MRIPVIPVKGPILARQLYDQPWLRHARDLDILVRDSDVEHTVDLLLQLGFTHEPGLNESHRRLLRRYAGQYVMFHATDAPVEPHWLLAPGTLAFGLDHELLWQHARPADFDGMPCLRLRPEDTLLLLCLHGAKDRWRQLKLVTDVAYFVHAHPDFDWCAAQSAAAAQGCARILGLGLLLAVHLLEAPVPASVVRQMEQDAAVRWLLGIAIGMLRDDTTQHEGPYCLRREYWLMHERARDRWAYAFRTACTPRPWHYQRLPLPSALEWAYHPLKLPWDYLLTPALGLGKRIAGLTRARVA
jgi:hypothetical protein